MRELGGQLHPTDLKSYIDFNQASFGRNGTSFFTRLEVAVYLLASLLSEVQAHVRAVSPR